jgi:hypothetical protein
MTTFSWDSIVKQTDRDFYEHSLRPWVYRFGMTKEAAKQGSSRRGRLVVQGEAQPGEEYSWKA